MDLHSSKGRVGNDAADTIFTASTARCSSLQAKLLVVGETTETFQGPRYLQVASNPKNGSLAAISAILSPSYGSANGYAQDGFFIGCDQTVGFLAGPSIHWSVYPGSLRTVPSIRGVLFQVPDLVGPLGASRGSCFAPLQLITCRCRSLRPA